jgi:hypothetical protein
VQDGVGAELRRRVASTSWSPILDFQLSPDACSIAYVRDDELFVVPVAFGEPVQITYGARGTGKVGIGIGIGHCIAVSQSVLSDARMWVLLIFALW